jgi:hypothetical protein
VYSEEIKGFLNSAQGKEMIRSLMEDLHDNLIKDAQKENTAETAFGLIKEASGVIKCIEHMMFLSVSMTERSED